MSKRTRGVPDAKQITRRAVLHRAAVGTWMGACGLALHGCAAPPQRRAVPAWPPSADLPGPDLRDERVVRFTAGIRPCREGSVRIELDRLDGKPLVHHYGHGGAGITLAPATATEAAELIAAAGVRPGDTVAVLGAGVVGLTTADRLLDQGYRVTVYAERFTPDTTSDVAGGQFAPSGVALPDPAQRERWLLNASAYYHAHLAADDDCGVRRVVNFTAPRVGGALRELPESRFRRTRLAQLPVAGIAGQGHAYETLLVTPPIFLPWLTRRLTSRGVRLRARRFDSARDIAALPEPSVVNCLGLGSGRLFDDPALVPVRGQLVLLQPQGLGYLFSMPRGYLFSRPDAVVLGGTYERGVADPTPDHEACRAILDRHRAYFGADWASEASVHGGFPRATARRSPAVS